MGSKSPQRFGFTNRFTVVVTISTLILIIGLCCAVESKRPDNDLVFDDSALSDDKLSAVNTNHENLRTKLVSKRSVSDPSDINNENVGLWQRLKRGVKNLFGIKNSDENSEKAHQQDVDIPKVEELKAVPAQKSQTQHETSKNLRTEQDNTLRRKRHRNDDEDDDEEDDDEDNEINGSGENDNDNDNDTIPDNDDKLIVDLPHVDDSKRFRLNLIINEMWNENLSNHNSDDFKTLALLVKRSIENWYKKTTNNSIMASLINVEKRDMFESYLSINIASELPKIVGNDLRDLFYKQINDHRVIEDIHVDPRDFILRPITEPKLELTSEPKKQEDMQELLASLGSQEEHYPEEDHHDGDYDSDPCDEDKEFQCQTDSKCIPLNERCDGEVQCKDGSDEKDCSSRSTDNKLAGESAEREVLEVPTLQINDTCRGDDKFKCNDGRLIICEVQKCDGVKNCPNGEDEENCPTGTDPDEDVESGDFGVETFNPLDISTEKIHVEDDKRKTIPADYDDEVEEITDKPEEKIIECSDNEFNCDVTRCISIDKHCDGTADCTDETDESNCPAPTTQHVDIACNEEHEYTCSDGSCIPNEDRCNQVSDCPNGEDEEDCECTSDEFTCKSGKCIPLLTVCDDVKDCPDGDDEENCDCARNEFRCIRGGTCIQLEQKCDGREDCLDGSDEYSCIVPTITQDLETLDQVKHSINKSTHDHLTSSSHLQPTYVTRQCKETEFRCISDGACIESYKRCNGYYDCTDHSDESDDLCDESPLYSEYDGKFILSIIY